jgi:hypothetical protein
MLKDIFKFYIWWFVIAAIVTKFDDIKAGAVELIKFGIIAAPFFTVAMFWLIFFVGLPIVLPERIIIRINRLTHFHDGRF